MRDVDLTIPVSVWDRLFEDAPGPAFDSSWNQAQRIREYRRGVLRDVENLLNTRNAAPAVPAEYSYVRNSLRTYGLPDFSSRNLSSGIDQRYIRQEMETALRRFEPRLSAVTVTVQTEQDEDEHSTLRLTFRVHALLKMDPEPELMSFAAILDKEKSQFVLQGDLG